MNHSLLTFVVATIILPLSACNGTSESQTEPSPIQTQSQHTERFTSSEQMVRDLIQVSLEDLIEANRETLKESRKMSPSRNPANNRLYIDANFNEIDDVAMLQGKIDSYNQPKAKIINENTRFYSGGGISSLHYRMKTKSGKDAYLDVVRGKTSYSFYVPELGAGGYIKAEPETQTLQVIIQAIENTELPTFEKLLLKPSNGKWQ